MSMRGYLLGPAVLLGAALGCGGNGSGAPDGAPKDGKEVVCAGDRWGGSAAMLAAISGCTVITGNLSITGNDLLSVELPLLTRVDGFLTLWGNLILPRASFATLETVGGYIDVSFNDALASLEMPALKHVNERGVVAAYDLLIRDNALPACQVDAIVQRLEANGFRGRTSVADDGGACPP